ncbi:hypothetical protein M9Y10_004643 [Tritrichomonas musculus]|uniref:KilA-N domain-containing protein n=1 Tax=Tritrichomonas musculus TaxID=1915356 RepID=A0ABR2JJ66_9EUKA
MAEKCQTENVSGRILPVEKSSMKINLFLIDLFLNQFLSAIQTMSSNTTNTATNTNTTTQPINNDYEYIQYNQRLRIIHSIKDDMYQMQSIITACHSNKRANKWFENESTKELLKEMREAEKCPSENLYQNRQNVEMGLRGYYVHRLLVNHVAIWSSSKYSYYIMKLLDSHFEHERQQLVEEIQQKKPRLVPSNKEHNYKYLIWKESNDAENTILHLVRRNKRTFRAVSTHNNDNERFYFKNDLPIAMTPNEDIKELVKNNFPRNDYTINGCNIIIKNERLEQLHTLIDEYFNQFQS